MHECMFYTVNVALVASRLVTVMVWFRTNIIELCLHQQRIQCMCPVVGFSLCLHVYEHRHRIAYVAHMLDRECTINMHMFFTNIRASIPQQ